jgi:hypothetical protein
MLLKRYTYLGNITNPVPAEEGDPQIVYNEMLIRAFAISTYAIDAYSTPNPTLYTNSYRDLLSYLGPAFLLSRGGVRYRMQTKQQNRIITTLQNISWAPPNTIITPGVDTGDFHDSYRWAPQQEFVQNLTGGAEVQIPQYHYTHARNHAVEITNGFAATYNDQIQDFNHVMLQIKATEPGNTTVEDKDNVWRFWRAVGDDFSMGCFVSVPPICSADPFE